MALLTRTAPKGSVCSLHHAGGRPPATTTYTHEFVNKPNKFFCDHHAELVSRLSKTRT